jgi:hypothetical protein
MKTGREDLDAMIRVASIPSNEPTFLLRAQDLCAADAVRAWAQLQLSAGGPVAVVEQALKQADAMDAWPIKKLPGADHLSEGAALRLAYEFERREWAWGDLSATTIAEARGGDAMLAKLQKLVNFVGVIATLREVGDPSEVNFQVSGSLRAVAHLLLLRAAEDGITAQADGFEPQAAK